jgi:hypothetical protein
MHTGLQEMFKLLKARNFSPNPLTEEKELEIAVHQVLHSLPYVKIVDGYLMKNETVLNSPMNDLIELATRTIEKGWDVKLLGELSKKQEYWVFQQFELNTFDQLAIEVNPEIFLHLFRSGEQVDLKIDVYLNYLQNVSKKYILYSLLPLFANPVCSECKGKGTVISSKEVASKKRETCPSCSGRGKIRQIKKKVNLFYLSPSDSNQERCLIDDQTDTIAREDNSVIKDYWRHYASTKLRTIANAILTANFMGNQTKNYFETCNNTAVIEQYKISLQKIDPRRGSYWIEFEEFQEHDRIVHLHKRYKEAEKEAIKNPQDKLTRKRKKKRKRAINEFYRANLDIFTGLKLDNIHDHFLGRSLDIAKTGRFNSNSWKRIFKIYHPDLRKDPKEFKQYFSS